MTPEEVKNELRYGKVYTDAHELAVDIAIEALEKQVPMKPLPYGICPMCGTELDVWKYCPVCGQAIGE